MTCKLVWTCDGGSCGRELKQEDIEASEREFAKWVPKDWNYAQTRQGNPEVFCAECREQAAEFWASKATTLVNCLREMQGRIEKHRNRFWNAAKSVPKPKLTVIGKVQ